MIARKILVTASPSSGPSFKFFIPAITFCSRSGAQRERPSSSFSRATSTANSVRRFRSCKRTVSISSIFFRQSLIVIGSPVAALASACKPKKRPRPLGGRGPESRNFVRLLARLAHSRRARFTGPLPPKGVAVGKTVRSVIKSHRNLNIRNRPGPVKQFVLLKGTARQGLGRVLSLEKL